MQRARTIRCRARKREHGTRRFRSRTRYCRSSDFCMSAISARAGPGALPRCRRICLRRSIRQVDSAGLPMAPTHRGPMVGWSCPKVKAPDERTSSMALTHRACPSYAPTSSWASPGPQRVPRERAAPAAEAAIYFTVAEALTNIAKHRPDSTRAHGRGRSRSGRMARLRSPGGCATRAASGRRG